MKTISKGKKIKEASKDHWEVFYNDNWACRMRGTDSDHPNETAEFDSVQDMLEFLDDEGIVYLDEEDYLDEDDRWVLDAYEENALSDTDLNALVERCNDMDITGGDTIIFSIIHMKGNKIIKEVNTQWDPSEFEYDDDDDVWDDEDYEDDWSDDE